MSIELDTKSVFTTCRKAPKWIRMQAVKMYCKVMSAANIAAIFEIVPRTVLQWVATFIHSGQSALVDGKVSERPLHSAWEQNATLVSNWRTQILPELLASAKHSGARVLFADKASVRSDYRRSTTTGG